MNTATLNLHNLGTKAKTKGEMYRILTCNAKMYLPPLKETSMFHVRDIFCMKKKALFNDEVKVRIIPQINGLRVRDLVWFLENKCQDGIDYLPERYHEKTLNRQFLVNLCNTFNEAEFDHMIQAAIKMREEHFVMKNAMEIQTDARIVDALNNSDFVSTSRGRSHLLIRKKEKFDKSDKHQEEIKEYESKVLSCRKDIDILHREIEDLTSELKNKELIEQENQKNGELLHSLYKLGIIDDKGKLTEESLSKL